MKEERQKEKQRKYVVLIVFESQRSKGEVGRSERVREQ